MGERIDHVEMGKVKAGNVYLYPIELPASGLYLIRIYNRHAELCRRLPGLLRKNKDGRVHRNLYRVNAES
jgi:hypothetical protein